jgi:hypothetical protein
LLSVRDPQQNTRLWRDYICESFCDTAAWYFAGVSSSEFNLARRWCEHRKRWISSTFTDKENCPALRC